MKKLVAMMAVAALACAMVVPLSASADPVESSTLADGTYQVYAKFDGAQMLRVGTDDSMCPLVVKDGAMTATVTLAAQGFDRLYLGSPEQAVAAADAEWLYPLDAKASQYTFEVPVSVLDTQIPIAARSKSHAQGTDGHSLRNSSGQVVWYEHKIVFAKPYDTVSLVTPVGLSVAKGSYEDTLPSGAAYTAQGLVAQWTAQTGDVTGYKLQYSSDPKFPDDENKTQTIEVAGASASKQGISENVLDKNTKYYFRICSVYHTKTSVWSASVTGALSAAKALGKGKTFTAAGATYKVTDATRGYVTLVKGPKRASVSINTAKYAGSKTYKSKTYKVTAIAANAFKENGTVKKAILGKNVKSIGKQAFAFCKNLASVTVGAGVSKIGPSAFKKTGKLKSLTVKTAKLTKSGIANSLKGSSVKTVKTSGISAKTKKSYKKWFSSAKTVGKSGVVLK